MDLSLVPDTYVPSVDQFGNYIDKIPAFVKTVAIICPCGARREKTYTTKTSFTNHIGTKTHQAWLQSLNANKSNFFAENEANKETVRMQRLLIAQLEKELETKKVTIEYLKRNIDWFRETLEQNQNDHIHFDG